MQPLSELLASLLDDCGVLFYAQMNLEHKIIEMICFDSIGILIDWELARVGLLVGGDGR